MASSDPTRAQEAAVLLGAVSALVRTARGIAHRRAQALGPSGTPYAVLKALALADARPGDLAVALSVSPSVISRALVPLEQHGLIERRQDAGDARAWVLTLAPHGRQTLEAHQQEYVALLAEAVADWDLEELQSATTALVRVERLFCDYAEQFRHRIAHTDVPTLPDTRPEETA
jgi:DNA-binding MarR family transcriptional regulator